MGAVQESLNSIRTAASRLNQLTDAAQDVVARVEAFLNDECSLRIPAEVLVLTGAPGVDAGEGGALTQECVMLAYCRIAGEYRLAVRIDEIRVDEEGAYERTIRQESMPWAAAPRDLKLKSFEKLPELLTEIAKEIARAVARTEATADAAKQVLAAPRVESPGHRAAPAQRPADDAGADAAPAPAAHKRSASVVEAWEDAGRCVGRLRPS